MRSTGCTYEKAKSENYRDQNHVLTVFAGLETPPMRKLLSQVLKFHSICNKLSKAELDFFSDKKTKLS